MAIIKKRTVHGLGVKDIEGRLAELRLDLARARAQAAVGAAPSDPGRVREIRKAIARLLTESNKKQEEV